MFPASSESIAVPAEVLGLGRDCFGDDVLGVAAAAAAAADADADALPPPGSAGALPSPDAISSSSLGRYSESSVPRYLHEVQPSSALRDGFCEVGWSGGRKREREREREGGGEEKRQRARGESGKVGGGGSATSE